MNLDAQQGSALIDVLGGTGQVAALCGVRAPSISVWRKRGIPRGWLMFFRERYPHLFDANGQVVVAGQGGGN